MWTWDFMSAEEMREFGPGGCEYGVWVLNCLIEGGLCINNEMK